MKKNLLSFFCCISMTFLLSLSLSGDLAPPAPFNLFDGPNLGSIPNIPDVDVFVLPAPNGGVALGIICSNPGYDTLHITVSRPNGKVITSGTLNTPGAGGVGIPPITVDEGSTYIITATPGTNLGDVDNDGDIDYEWFPEHGTIQSIIATLTL